MPLLTLPEAARVADCPESRIRKAIRSGALPARKFGVAYAIRSQDLSEYLEPGCEPRPPALPAAVIVEEADWGAS